MENFNNPDIYESLSISVSTWKEHNCISPSLYFLNPISIIFYSQQKYIDLNDKDQPLKLLYKTESSFTSDSLFESVKNTFKIVKNQIELEDTWWEFLFGSTTKYLNNIKYEESKITSEERIADSHFSFIMSLSRESNHYSRKSSNFLETLGFIGGLVFVSQLLFGTLLPFIWGFAIKNNFKKELEKASSEIEKLNDSITKLTKSSKKV